MQRIKNIHLVGIGGSGMNGIAEVLLNQGYKVSGSDLHVNAVTKRLADLGASINFGHISENVSSADIVIVSSAIAEDNPELIAARLAGIPILPRAQMLAELMRFHIGIAVAGTHGKTTTTSLVASILAEAGLDPTFVIGGVLNSIGTHAKLGGSRYFVAEADESDASFLRLHPMVSVVTNIEPDHMQTYDNNFAKLRQAFLNFLHNLPFYGTAVVCADDPTIKNMLTEIARHTITYGFSRECDLWAENCRQDGMVCNFTVNRKDQASLAVSLNLPGRHNVLNALAAIAVATECGVGDDAIAAALRQFKGVGRRLQMHGEFKTARGKITLIDDYGHHPSEIKVSLQALREAWPNRRIVLVFQPHRYSRTQALFDDFADALSMPDMLVLMEVYAAGEHPIAGVDSRALARNIRQRGHIDPIFVESIDDLPKALHGVLQDGDVVLLQGAGSIGKAAAGVVQW